MGTLPIYRLATPDVGREEVVDLAHRAFGVRDFTLSEVDTRLVLRDGRRVVEVDRASGGVWLADEALLWNPEAAGKGKVPSEGEARDLAEKCAEELGLLPRFGARSPFTLATSSGGTHLVQRSGTEKRRERQLDAQVTYEVRVAGPDKRALPVVGGGGKLKITLGEGGRLVSACGTWREPTGTTAEATTVPPEAVEQEFAALFDGVELRDTEVVLAYYAEPFGVVQEFLYPVYVLRGTAVFGEETVPLRQPCLAATDFGPERVPPRPQPPRTEDRTVVTPTAEARARRSYRTASNPFEFGASYIGTSGGLPGSQANTQGLVDELSADGWLRNFVWGDANAWESDWNRNDDAYVDAADLVWYTGHANKNGWVLSSPDDGFLRFSELGGSPGTPGDKWGRNDLEWAIVAACGPLQDEILAKGGGNVLSRWDGAFDGLHMLLGYGAVTFDNTEEGRRVVRYATQGQTLRSAWFRAAQEIQPSTNGCAAPDGPTVWVGAMWAFRSGVSPSGDHLWGHGSVSADPTAPTGLACMWTTC